MYSEMTSGSITACTGRVNSGMVSTSKYSSSATAFHRLDATLGSVVLSGMFLVSVMVSVTAARKNRSGLK